jgi:cystathionine gamma-synthase/cystathionine gamma-lyase/cystathionine beta-lyase
MKLETALIHAGEPRPGWGGAVAMPIFQSSTFLYQPGAGYHDIRYGRLSNTPNHEALHRKLAALEGTESALVTASGMAAISAALLSVLRTGDHLLAQEGLYGGTHDLLTGDFAQLGIEVSFVDGEDRSAWAAALRKDDPSLLLREHQQSSRAGRRSRRGGVFLAQQRPDLDDRQHVRDTDRPAPNVVGV